MEWNAEQYHRLSEPQFDWGLQVLARVADLPPRGDETVLDAGCGTGRLTVQLAGLFPRGRVVATDLSAPMLQTFAQELNNGRHGSASRAPVHTGQLGDGGVPDADRVGTKSKINNQKSKIEFAASRTERLSPDRTVPDHRVSLVRADFQRLPFVSAFDIVFSTAAFHWAPDHDAVFENIFHALKPHGRLVAQCGGGANLADVREREGILMRDPRFAPYFREWRPPWNYADVPTTKQRLLDAGFIDAEVWLENSPVTMPDAETFRAFAETVVERTQVGLISDPDLRDQYLDCFVDLAAGDYTYDYVRLNINAQRS
jgi:trans-aconitate 2-methyltransferase